MAGQLGNVRNTIQNLVIVKILLEENTILVKGSIPGHDGSDVIIKPTRKKYTPKEILTKQSVKNEEIKETKAADPSAQDSKKEVEKTTEPETAKESKE